MEAPLNKVKEEYKDYAVLCECGMRTVRAYIENISQVMELTDERNIYDTIETRIKEFESVEEKFARKYNEPITIEGIKKHIRDVAGIRIVTLFKDDVYKIRDAIKRQPSLVVIEEKDYIKQPKNNGYRSLHLIVSVLIYYKGEAWSVPVEIQIRTKAMDLWASVEHYCYYKKGSPSKSAPEMFAEIATILDGFDTNALALRDHGAPERE